MTRRHAKIAHPNSGGGGGGFTLIELLAVIVIVSMIAGVTTISLASASDSAQLNATIARWRDLDARARLFARSLGPVTMRLDRESRSLRLYYDGLAELLSHLTLPRGTNAQIVAQRPTDVVNFDRLGRSADYEVEVSISERTVHWHVCGLTGWITENQP